MGSIARQYQPAQADVIPLLIGDQRIGKSNCLRYLACRQEWYTDTTSDVSDPKLFLESIRGSAIVELSEATAIRSRESERTKSFISKREDTYRRPYERAATTVYRRWVLIATSNLKTPFTDITGNMRYFPIYCEDRPENLIKQFFTDP
jgi:putative DNA primase/helicase